MYNVYKFNLIDFISVLTSFGIAFDGVVWYLGKRLNLYENMPIIFEKELNKQDTKNTDVDEM